MNEKQRTRTSKFLSLVLRHEPQKIGLELDPNGWVNVEQLLSACNTHGVSIERADLEEIVAQNDKQRFAFSEDGHLIRANQGHSVEVELGYEVQTAPARLYHGTASQFVESIRKDGLRKGARHHVHLSNDTETARKVGGRRGKPVVLTVRADAMQEAGRSFYLSNNGVWLVEDVPAEFIEFPTEAAPSSVNSGRNARARLAQETVSICETGSYVAPSGRQVFLADAIEHSRTGTVLYSLSDTMSFTRTEASATSIEVTDESTFQAISRLAMQQPRHLACLNFASAKNPGGGFLGGSQAQEEALARSSALYPCLLTQPTYYEQNRANRSALYLDLAISSPAVPFFRSDEGDLLETPRFASVITAPAPNAGAIAVNEPEKMPQIIPTLRRRAEMVLRIAALNNVSHLILGAWGCGVFRNDPSAVAECFKELVQSDGPFAGAFDVIVFAVLDRTATRATYQAFRNTFNQLEPGSDKLIFQ